MQVAWSLQHRAKRTRAEQKHLLVQGARNDTARGEGQTRATPADACVRVSQARYRASSRRTRHEGPDATYLAVKGQSTLDQEEQESNETDHGQD